MKSRHLITLMAVIAVISVNSCAMKARPQVPAKISFLAGTVRVNGIEAQLGQMINPGDIVETLAQSFCRIIVDDKNIIGMQDDCTLVYKIDRDDALLDLKKGFLGIIVKNRKNIENFRVNTPTTTASIRGTTFFIGIESPDRVYTCTCNGVVHYHPEGHAKGERYSAVHHKGAYFTRRGGTVATEPGDMKYHTDGDMEMLASDINVRIDWTKIGE